MLWILLIILNILVWYPALSFWFLLGWEVTWLNGPCGGHFALKCLIQGHAILYFLNYKLFGWDPTGWYLTALILHIVAVLLSFTFIQKLTGNKTLAFLIALLFGVNVTYHDVINWGSFNGLYALMMVLFLLASLFHINFRTSRHKSKWCWYSANLIVFVLAFTIRESALILPFFLLLTDVYLNKFSFSKKYVISLFWVFLPYAATLVGFFFLRKSYGGAPYDYIDPTVQYRIRLLSQGLYNEYIRRTTLLVGIFAAPQMVPFPLLNFIRSKFARYLDPYLINYYFFPLVGFAYMMIQVFLIFCYRRRLIVRNLLLFSFFWFLIPTLSASLPITFTDDVLMREYNSNTPARWRYFAFLGSIFFWVTIFWDRYHNLIKKYSAKKRLLRRLFIAFTLFVLGLNWYYIRSIQRQLYATVYKPGREFYTSFRKEFKLLPKDYIFYAFPGAGNLKDYLAEWHHIRKDYYPDLTQDRGITWLELQIDTLLQRYQEHTATLSSTFFLDYDPKMGIMNKTGEAREAIKNQREQTHTIYRSVTSNDFQSLDTHTSHQITIPLDPKLHVEIPYNVEININARSVQAQASLSEFTIAQLQALIAYTQSRIDFLNNVKASVCDTGPVGTRPGAHILPRNIVDGNIGWRSYWVANCRPAWVVLDLGREKRIGAVAFHALVDGGHIPSAYTVEVSSDNKTWNQVLRIDDNTSYQRIDKFPQAVNARYVKYSVLQTKEGGLLVLNELEVIDEKGLAVLGYYKNFEKLLEDSYRYGGSFVRLSWSVNPDDLPQDERIKNYSMYKAIPLDGITHTYEFEPNENEFFSGSKQFLNKYINSLYLDFGGLPSEEYVSTVHIVPRYTYPDEK